MIPPNLNLDSELDRRQAIAGVLALVVAAPALSGCIVGLLRVFVGRGLAGALVRTARLGRAASTLTFGRGIAVGAKVVRANVYRSTSGVIIGPRQRVVATFDTSANNSVVKVDRSPVFSSQRTRYGYEHFDRNGICGRSYLHIHKDEIRHETDDGILLAIDRINEISKTIEHFDASGRRIGSSGYGLRGDEIDVRADDNSIKSIESLRTELGLQCPESKQAYDEWLEAKRLCGMNDARACQDVTEKRIRHELLKKRCMP